MNDKIYAHDGVNVELGDSMSQYAGAVCRESWSNSPYVKVVDFADGHFRGPRGDFYQNLPNGWFNMRAPDGVGTKVGIHSADRGEISTAWDVMAMTCGDNTRWGGLNLIFSNVLDVATLGTKDSPTFKRFGELFVGLARAAEEIGVVLQGGETAELGVFVGSEDLDAVTKFNWAGFACGINTEAKLINGSAMERGDVVVALREKGFRSNGMSTVRKALSKKFGPEWFKNPDAASAIHAAAEPSVLYDRMLAIANGWYAPNFEPHLRIKGIAHITGGGIPSKFAKDMLFPLGLSADLSDLYDPPTIMKQCAQWRGISARECYEVWNGGQGMLVVLDRFDVEHFIKLARLYNLEAKACGTLFKNARRSPVLRIRSKFKEGILFYGAD